VLWRRARHGHPHPAGLICLVVLAAAGCGGGDGSGGDYPAGVSRPIAKVEFLAEADRICHSTNVRVEAAADGLVSTGDDPPPPEVRRIVIAVVIPALEAEVRAIRALGEPAGDEREVAAIIAATERGIAEIRSDPVAVLDGPPPGLREAARLSRAYGSRECGVPGG
jgi:hypothetical protein